MRAGKIRAIFLAVFLIAGSTAVYVYRPFLGDPRRFILALAAIGFFFAPLSDKRLKLFGWLPALALVAWGGQIAGTGRGGFALWFLCSVAGAYLALRAGGRAAVYYLPKAESDEGRTQRGTIRKQLWASVLLFLAVYLFDGFSHPPNVAVTTARGGVLMLSAIGFVRFCLLQAKFLGIAAVPIRLVGLVPAQRWFVLLATLLVGGTRLPDQWLLRMGETTGTLLVTSAMLLVVSGIVLVLALVRLERAGVWPRRSVRIASFVAGIGLALALAAVVVELEGWGPTRYASFGTFCTLFLVVLPFVHLTTRLLADYPKLALLVPTPVVSVMMAPVTAVNGPRWELTSTGFLYAFALLVLFYHLLVTIREKRRGIAYLGASIAALVFIALSNGIAWAETGGAWRMFLVALGFVLYAVDLLERSVLAKPQGGVTEEMIDR